MAERKPRDILVTSALPYANGPLHLGHLLEQVQTDIWVRFQKSRGHNCRYLCADDAHGTAIMLTAEQQGISPEAQIEAMHKQHLADSRGFLVEFDNFHSTHSEENRQLSEQIYRRLRDGDVAGPAAEGKASPAYPRDGGSADPAAGDQSSPARGGHVEVREITQAFDPQRQLFLSDRYIKGTCPKCKALDQYGDNCESCGATYSPSELIDATSTLSGATPVNKASEHYFFTLAHFEDTLRSWIDSGTLQSQVANKLKEWLDAGLQAWDISRDAPYFGFEIPGAPGKYFYVWLDAPIGYMASHKHLCDSGGQVATGNGATGGMDFADSQGGPGNGQVGSADGQGGPGDGQVGSADGQGGSGDGQVGSADGQPGAGDSKQLFEGEAEDFRRFWQAPEDGSAPDTELYHFIGKDIINFHGLFWPAMLEAAGCRKPTAIYAHGFLTVNGTKMSKSRGTFINARTYLDHLDPEYLRYYFAAKLGSGVEDIDLNLEDFVQRVNSDLVGKVVNIASRCAGFLEKGFDNRLSSDFDEEGFFLHGNFYEVHGDIADFFENREYSKAMQQVMVLADWANRYIDKRKPWVLAKEEGCEKEVHEVCSAGINLFRCLMVYLKPVMPAMAKRAEGFLNTSLNWPDPLVDSLLHYDRATLPGRHIPRLLVDHKINSFKPLLQRIDPAQVAAMVEASKEE